MVVFFQLEEMVSVKDLSLELHYIAMKWSLWRGNRSSSGGTTRTMKLSKRHKNIWLRNLHYAKCLFQLLKDFDHRYRTLRPRWWRQPWNCPKAKWQFLPSFLPFLAIYSIHTYPKRFPYGFHIQMYFSSIFGDLLFYSPFNGLEFLFCHAKLR